MRNLAALAIISIVFGAAFFGCGPSRKSTSGKKAAPTTVEQSAGSSATAIGSTPAGEDNTVHPTPEGAVAGLPGEGPGPQTPFYPEDTVRAGQVSAPEVVSEQLEPATVEESAQEQAVLQWEPAGEEAETPSASGQTQESVQSEGIATEAETTIEQKPVAADSPTVADTPQMSESDSLFMNGHDEPSQPGSRLVDFRADLMLPVKITEDSSALNLLGNVLLYHNGAVITCDSAVRYNDRRMEFFKRVVINKATTFIYGDRADYNGDLNLASVYAPIVKVVDEDAVLYTYQFNFNTLDNIGRFGGGGTLVHGDNEMESYRGFYYTDDRVFVGIDSVELRNPEYQMVSDSASYNLDTEVASFYVKSYIWNDKGEILKADRGDYYNATAEYRFMKESYILTETREVWADSLDYNSRAEDAILRRNVQINDEEQHVSAFGDYAQYWGGDWEQGLLTLNPSLMSYDPEEPDTLYMRADSMFFLSFPYDYSFSDGDEPVPGGALTMPVEELISSGGTPVQAAGQEGEDPEGAEPELDGEQPQGTDDAAPEQDSEGNGERELAESRPPTKAELKAAARSEKDRKEKEKRAEKERKADEKRAIRTANKAERKALKEAIMSGNYHRHSDGTFYIGEHHEHAHQFPEEEGYEGTGEDSDSLSAEILTGIDTVTYLIMSDSMMAALADSLGMEFPEHYTGEYRVDDDGAIIPVNTEGMPLFNDNLVAQPQEPEDTIQRIFRAFNNVRIFRNDVQAVCDSLVGFSKDSTLHLYIEPVLWSDENQITSDSMYIYTRDGQLYKAEFVSRPFMTSELDTLHYNQVKGKFMVAWFRDNDIYRHDVFGNGETYYWMEDDDTYDLMAFMVIECADMTFLFDEKTLDQIIYRLQPVYSIYPMDKIPPTQEHFLPGFKWEDARRPKSKEDVFDRTMRPSEREAMEAMPLPQFPITDRILKDRDKKIKNGIWRERNDVLSPLAVEYVRFVELRQAGEI